MSAVMFCCFVYVQHASLADFQKFFCQQNRFEFIWRKSPQTGFLFASGANPSVLNEKNVEQFFFWSRLFQSLLLCLKVLRGTESVFMSSSVTNVCLLQLNQTDSSCFNLVFSEFYSHQIQKSSRKSQSVDL